MSTTTTAERLYVGETGTTCHVGGELGTVVYRSHRADGERFVLVASQERPVVFYVAIGAPGEHEQWADVLHFREIATRDEFDAITGLTQVRESMGWPKDHAVDGRDPVPSKFRTWRSEWGVRVDDNWVHCPAGEGCARRDADRSGGTVVRRSWIEMIP